MAMERLRPTVSPDLRCALCHDALEGERIECGDCHTQLHRECAQDSQICPTLACEVEIAPWRFEEAMEARDGPLVRLGTVGGALGGALVGVILAFVSGSGPGTAEGVDFLVALWRAALMGAMQGVILTLFGLFLVRHWVGTPPLRPE
jgi:hypothetical protein